MKERNGVRIGQRVRDAMGKDLGKVTDLYDWGFAVAKGFPILFRREWVARYDEVRGVRDGALVIARSDDDLEALARGGVAPSWQIPGPVHFPHTATPAEARGVFEEIASGAIDTAAPDLWASPEPPPAPRDSRPSAEVPDMRRYSDSLGQSLAKVPPASKAPATSAARTPAAAPGGGRE